MWYFWSVFLKVLQKWYKNKIHLKKNRRGFFSQTEKKSDCKKMKAHGSNTEKKKNDELGVNYITESRK
jgi:hypothetical protein